MGRGFTRYVVPGLVGFAPALLVLLTWSPDGRWSVSEMLTRAYALPIAFAELCTIAIALREGLLRSVRGWNWSWPALLAILTLAVIAVTSAWLAPSRTVSIVLTVYWIIHGMFAVSLAHLCGRIFTVEDLSGACIAGFATFAAELVLYVALIPDWAAFDWKNSFLAFTHIRHAGYYLAAAAALSLGAMSTAERRRQWLGYWACAWSAFGLALWTGSRGAALAVVGTIALAFVLLPKFRSVRTFVSSVAGAAAAVTCVSLLPAAPNYLMGLTRTVQATAADDVTTGRTTIWTNVIEAIRGRPLFGYGEGQMATVAPFSTMVQPHDSLLQVTLAWGMVGLFCVLVLSVAYLWRALPAVRRNKGLTAPFLAVSAIAILSLYDGALYYALPQSLFFGFAAAIASRWAQTPDTAAADNHSHTLASG